MKERGMLKNCSLVCYGRNRNIDGTGRENISLRVCIGHFGANVHLPIIGADRELVWLECGLVRDPGVL